MRAASEKSVTNGSPYNRCQCGPKDGVRALGVAVPPQAVQLVAERALQIAEQWFETGGRCAVRHQGDLGAFGFAFDDDLQVARDAGVRGVRVRGHPMMREYVTHVGGYAIQYWVVHQAARNVHRSVSRPAQKMPSFARVGAAANRESGTASERGRWPGVNDWRRETDAHRESACNPRQRLWRRPERREARAAGAARLVGADQGGHVGRQFAGAKVLLTRSLARVQARFVSDSPHPGVRAHGCDLGRRLASHREGDSRPPGVEACHGRFVSSRASPVSGRSSERFGERGAAATSAAARRAAR